MDLPKRKPNRLLEYDYSTPNAYFITISTKSRKNFFWTDASANVASADEIPLTAYGRIVRQAMMDTLFLYHPPKVDLSPQTASCNPRPSMLP